MKASSWMRCVGRITSGKERRSACQHAERLSGVARVPAVPATAAQASWLCRPPAACRGWPAPHARAPACRPRWRGRRAASPLCGPAQLCARVRGRAGGVYGDGARVYVNLDPGRSCPITNQHVQPLGCKSSYLAALHWWHPLPPHTPASQGAKQASVGPSGPFCCL